MGSIGAPHLPACSAWHVAPAFVIVPTDPLDMGNAVWVLAVLSVTNSMPWDYIILIAVLIAVWWFASSSRCPKCKKRRALKKTQWGRNEIEWKCKYCSYREFRSVSDGGGG